jgi:histidine triad (HIT) family protein
MAVVSTCLFCRIASGEIPASLVYEDEELVAFNDINPQAPLHVLVIPRRHVATLNDLTEGDDGLIGRMLRRAAAIAAGNGYAARGYRTVFNCNSEAGQTVFHIHLHLLDTGGRPRARLAPGLRTRRGLGPVRSGGRERTACTANHDDGWPCLSVRSSR